MCLVLTMVDTKIVERYVEGEDKGYERDPKRAVRTFYRYRESFKAQVIGEV